MSTHSYDAPQVECMDPCALIVLMLPGVKLDAKLAGAVRETLIEFTWIDPETDEPDMESALQQVASYEQRKKSNVRRKRAIDS